MPGLEIDGRRIQAREGQTILDVCREHGIYVPSLCYHPRLKKGDPVGSAWWRWSRSQACSLPAILQFTTIWSSGQIREGLAARRGILEFLLASGDHNCMICEANGTCELQEAAYRLGIEAASLPEPAG